MPDPTLAEQEEHWKSVGEQLLHGAIDAWIKSDVQKTIVNGAADVTGTLLGIAIAAVAPVGIGLARAIAQSEDVVAPALSSMAAGAVNDIFGSNIPASAFDKGIGSGARAGASTALGKGLIDLLGGGTKTVVPGDAAASRYVTAMVNMALEGWYQKWFFEFMTSLLPQLDIGKIENFGCLDDKIVKALGLNGISRRILRPIVNAAIVTPLEWKVNKELRPTMLGATQAARQIARGFGDKEKWLEQLRRAGYDEQCINAILSEQTHAFSAGDVRTFVSRAWWTNDRGLAHLRDQGYTEDEATDALRLEGLRRIDQLETAEANAILGAYAARDIDRATFTGALGAAVTVPRGRALDRARRAAPGHERQAPVD